MNIRFLENPEVIYEFDLQKISSDIIQLSGENIPTQYTKGFEIIDYNDKNELYVTDSYVFYNVIYDIGTDYIQFTSDTNIYYNYLIYDEQTFFVKEFQTKTDQEVNSNYYLIQYGQGKAYKEFNYTIFDKDGLYLYKIINNEVVSITKDERNAFIEGKKYAMTFETIKLNKITEINVICNHSIEEGIDYNNSHYRFTNDDQKNIATLIKFIETTGLNVPYHADGESCRAYTPEELTAIYALQNYNLMHHTSYANQLKLYVNTLTTIDEINQVMYGQELTGEYLKTYNEMIAMTKAIAEQYLGPNGLNL